MTDNVIDFPLSPPSGSKPSAPPATVFLCRSIDLDDDQHVFVALTAAEARAWKAGSFFREVIELPTAPKRAVASENRGQT